jgi:hypothetical protein
MSLSGLKAMHRATSDLLAYEDKQPAGQVKIYGVREFPDWKVQADEIEAEFDRRNEAHTKIQW